MSLELERSHRPSRPQRSPIEIWEYSLSEQIRQTNKRRSEFSIARTSSENPPTSCASRVLYETAQKGLWDVYVVSSSGSQQESSKNDPGILHHAAENLVPRQKLRYPTDPVAQIHASVIDFVTINWPVLETRLHHSTSRIFQPQCLAEVALPNHGQADAVALCADGTVCVIEVGTCEKPAQSLRYQTGLGLLFEGIPMKIKPFVAAYQKKDYGMQVQLRELTDTIDNPAFSFLD